LKVDVVKILIVEDSEAHLQIIQYVLKKNKIDAEFFFARDGQEALDFLYNNNSLSILKNVLTPDLILLDLNLPKRDGREVLKIVKDDAKLKEIPVVIVSTSDREEDLNYAFATGAAAYISKSVGFDNFCTKMAQITNYARVVK
jgi:two-component system, chemotaxis family, response regulator Rcp1